ncbi:mmaa protein [Capsaspora owczarzaki ATCC 30864]|uniref:Mmaa protein n=1 Tax=Capsaspora owczarzaki (strain ATCC 30864) TaxID=595528 RepID=A0A0D2VM03_CAPO3|nr:mmaa protein [Capsaspora owczarzaki ATCC 30864]KJE91117.1 mmaa protein [Capsaspora owczarzaki ATCC 30864]|eukprot:XP_004349051.1 mmaa protein [Capsaspora owczarzaki ATCC 30864]
MLLASSKLACAATPLLRAQRTASTRLALLTASSWTRAQAAPLQNDQRRGVSSSGTRPCLGLGSLPSAPSTRAGLHQHATSSSTPSMSATEREECSARLSVPTRSVSTQSTPVTVQAPVQPQAAKKTENDAFNVDHLLHLKEADQAWLQKLYDGILQQDRSALARGITLVESWRRDHRRVAQNLLDRILDVLHDRWSHVQSLGSRAVSTVTLKNNQTTTTLPTPFRIGLSGPPGAGKSTFIETFGMFLVNQGLRVAVLAVDPSSSVSGGSILGDKTRMTELSRNDAAYVRPSPSRGSLGGVTRNTSDAIVLCEGSGYDVIIIETVGVGQSETAVADMVDLFTLIVPPGGGDELQGIKKGIVELADFVIVNKADGDLLPAARKAKSEYTSAMKLLRPRTASWTPEIAMLSSLDSTGLADAWKLMLQFYDSQMKGGEFFLKRSQQRKRLMWKHVSDGILERFQAHPEVSRVIAGAEQQVMQGLVAPGLAADELLDRFR